MSDVINLRLTAQDGLSAILRGAENQLRSLSKTADTVKQKLGMTNEQLLTMGAALGASSAAVGALAYKMQSTLSGWAESGKNLEVALVNLKYNAQATEEEFDRISKRVMETGKNSLYSATQATEAMYELMSFGLQGAIEVTDEAGRHFTRKTAEMALDATLNYATMTHGLVSLADAAKLSGAMVQKAHLDMSKVSYDEEGNMITQLDRMYDKVSKASILTGLKPEDMPAIMNSARAAISMVNMDLSTALAMVGQLKSSGMDNAESGNKLVEYARKAADLGAKYLTTDMYAHIRAAMGKDPMKGATTMLGKRQTYWLDTVFGSRSEFEKAMADENGNFRDPLQFMQTLDKKLDGLGYSRVKKIETLRKMFGTTESMQMFLTFAEQASFTPSENIYAVDEWGRKLDGVNEKLLYQKDITYKGIEAMLAYRYSIDASKGESQRYADMMKDTLWGEIQHFNALKDTVKAQYGKYVGELAVAVMRLTNGLMRFFSAIEDNFPNVARAFTWLLVTLTAIGALLAVIGLPLAMISLALGRFATIGHNLGKMTGIKFLSGASVGGVARAVTGGAGVAAAAKFGGSALSFLKNMFVGKIALGTALGVPKVLSGASALTGWFGLKRFASFFTALKSFSLVAEARGLVGLSTNLLSTARGLTGLSRAAALAKGIFSGSLGVGFGLAARATRMLVPGINLVAGAGRLGFAVMSKFATAIVKPMIFFTGFLSIFKGIFSLFTDATDKSKTFAQQLKDFFKYFGGASALFKKALFGDGKITDEDVDAAGTLGVVTLKLIDNPIFNFFRRMVDFSHRVDKEFNDMVDSINKTFEGKDGQPFIDKEKFKGSGLIGKGVGGIAGWVGGQALATAVGMPFLGPVLGMVTAFLGQWVGQRVANWINLFVQASKQPGGLQKIIGHVEATVKKAVIDFGRMVSANAKEMGGIAKLIATGITYILKGLFKGLYVLWKEGLSNSWDRLKGSKTQSEIMENSLGYIMNFVPVFGEMIFQILKALCEGICEAFIGALDNPQVVAGVVGAVIASATTLVLTRSPKLAALAGTFGFGSGWKMYETFNGGVGYTDSMRKYGSIDERAEKLSNNQDYMDKHNWDVSEEQLYKDAALDAKEYESYKQHSQFRAQQSEQMNAAIDASINRVQQVSGRSGQGAGTNTLNFNLNHSIEVKGKGMSQKELDAVTEKVTGAVQDSVKTEAFQNALRPNDRARYGADPIQNTGMAFVTQMN